MKVELSPETIDAIARRVIDLMRDEQAPASGEMVDAAEIARRFGVTRSWVYEHRQDLGAVELGTGKRPRLRFDPERVSEMLACARDRQPPVSKSPAKPADSPVRRRPGARAGARSGSDLLPIRGRR